VDCNTPSPVKQKILVVDDEEAILTAMRNYFGHLGYEVDCAREREEAEALIGSVQYACVIADLRLTAAHGADGLEVLATVRQRCPSTRTIILTAYGSPAVESEAKRRGVDAFLHKPRPLADVAQVVMGLVGARA
jgi:CheY-like chemotaxis protein